MRHSQVLYFSIFASAALFVLNACSSSGAGLSSTAGCSASCINAAAAAASGPSISLNSLSNIGFTMANGFSLYANCNSANTGSGIFCYSGKSVSSAGIFPQQYQLSGYCSTGGAASSLIYATVETSNGVVDPTDVYGNAYSTSPGLTTTCDNGRFSMLLTQPGYNSAIYPLCTSCSNTTLLNGGASITNSPVLRLIVTLMAGSSLTTLSPASQTATTFQVSYYY